MTNATEANQGGARLGIGVLAHDEEGTLPRLLRSLFDQSIFHEHRPRYSEIHIACVPNGCRDLTASVAKRTLLELAAALPADTVSWSIHELSESGKANAWNCCVHELLSGSEYVCMTDADIIFAERETIHRAVSALVSDSRVCVATDLPLKRIDAHNFGISGRLSLLFSRASPPGPTEICGQFYCARGSVIRRIWMPPGMPVEDGLLRALVITDEFRCPEDPRRIIRVPDAAHYFEPYLTARAVWRHKKRLMIGSTLNALLFEYLWKHSQPYGAGQLLRDKLNADGLWLSRYLKTAVENRAWVVPMDHVLRRLSVLQGQPFDRSLKRAPAALVATLLDLAVAVSANREIKRGNGLGFW